MTHGDGDLSEVLYTTESRASSYKVASPTVTPSPSKRTLHPRGSWRLLADQHERRDGGVQLALDFDVQAVEP